MYAGCQNSDSYATGLDIPVVPVDREPHYKALCPAYTSCEEHEKVCHAFQIRHAKVVSNNKDAYCSKNRFSPRFPLLSFSLPLFPFSLLPYINNSQNPVSLGIEPYGVSAAAISFPQ